MEYINNIALKFIKIILTKTPQCLVQSISFMQSVTSLLNFLEDISTFQASNSMLIIKGITSSLLVLNSPVDYASECNPGIFCPANFIIASSSQGWLIWSSKEILISFVFSSVMHLTYSVDSLVVTERNLLPPFFCLRNFWYFCC